MLDEETIAAADAPAVAPDDLYERIERDERVFVLDVRAASDHEEWTLGGDAVDTLNHPYFDLLDGVPDGLHDALPDDREIVVVCAKGKSSVVIADTLRDAGYDASYLDDGMRGWARVYRAVELDHDGDATILQYRRPSSGCLAYLVVSDGEAAVVDPLRAFTDRYVADATAYGADLAYALDTHVHADHVSGIRDLAAETDADAVLPGPAAARGVQYDTAYETVADGDRLPVGNTTIEVVHTPGHTTGMTTYAVEGVLLTGDGLFTESVARPDLEDPDAARDAAATLHDSLTAVLSSFPDDTVVAPAHYGDAATPNADGSYTATLADLAASLPLLSLDRPTFVERVASDMPPRPANHERIIATNLGREAASDEEAFTLELGPNNCAASAD
ncbi:MBL fold metallo-hydrolase [Salarchaeum sp. III]|uniref:MBL fold metallo-hydrolase n=1 Tax=Salarchaeum sp. III TaxID=3107927 RepID=UPI002ED7B6B7